jgi:dephospho-CoA kinase
MFKIGIAGGIGSGKSTVTKRLGALGCGIIDADLLSHRVIEYPEVIDQMRARWHIGDNGCVGRSALNCDQSVLLGPAPYPDVNRQAVAKIIFNNPDERKFLESVMHPLIDQEIRNSLARYNDSFIPAVVLDVPLLFEGHWKNLCEFIVFVDCPASIRFERYADRMKGNVIGPDDFALREAAQWPPEKKQLHSHVTLSNDRDQAYLWSQVDALWHDVLRTKITELTPVNNYLFWKLPHE